MDLVERALPEQDDESRAIQGTGAPEQIVVQRTTPWKFELLVQATELGPHVSVHEERVALVQGPEPAAARRTSERADAEEPISVRLPFAFVKETVLRRLVVSHLLGSHVGLRPQVPGQGCHNGSIRHPTGNKGLAE